MKYWVMMQQLLQDRRGIAAVEYAVLIAVVGGVLFAVFSGDDNAFQLAIEGLIDTGLGDSREAGGLARE